MEYCVPRCFSGGRGTGTGESAVAVAACAGVGEESDVGAAQDAVFGADTVEEVDDVGEVIYTTDAGFSTRTSSALSLVWAFAGGQ